MLVSTVHMACKDAVALTPDCPLWLPITSVVWVVRSVHGVCVCVCVCGDNRVGLSEHSVIFEPADLRP